jgi:hypothetical protein
MKQILELRLSGIFSLHTSHGKWPCDRLGGTVKKLAARTSLQRAFNQQNLTPAASSNSATKVCLISISSFLQSRIIKHRRKMLEKGT